MNRKMSGGFVSCVMLGLSAGLAGAQTTYTHVGNAGDWALESSWTPPGVPAARDNLRFTTGAMVMQSSLTVNNVTVESDEFVQLATAMAGALTLNIRGHFTQTGGKSQTLFRGSTGAEGANTLAVEIGGNVTVSGTRTLHFGQWRDDKPTPRSNNALRGLTISGVTELKERAVVSIYTSGATAILGEVKFGEGGGTLLLNNGTPTAGSGSSFPATRTVRIAGLSGGAGSSIIAASENTHRSAATTLELTGGGMYNFAGRIINRSDNSIYGSVITLEKTGAGVQGLSGELSSTYAGPTNVRAGGLIVNTELARTPAIQVDAGAWIGGRGTVTATDSRLTLAQGAKLIFHPEWTLTLPAADNVALDSSFGIDSLVQVDGKPIDWSTVQNGTYTLLAGTTSGFGNIANLGQSNAKRLGGGRSAWFESGGLKLVVR